MNITNVEIGGLDWMDYPKFCDAYVEDCEIDGVAATEEQLNAINDDGQLVYEMVWEYVN